MKKVVILIDGQNLFYSLKSISILERDINWTTFFNSLLEPDDELQRTYWFRPDKIITFAEVKEPPTGIEPALAKLTRFSALPILSGSVFLFLNFVVYLQRTLSIAWAFPCKPVNLGTRWLPGHERVILKFNFKST